MAEIKLTKNELKSQRVKLDQLQKYLPTLQLKKALLQAEVVHARYEMLESTKHAQEELKRLKDNSPLLSMDLPFSLEEAVSIDAIEVEHENIAGTEMPKLQKVLFHPFSYDIYTTPIWVDGLLDIVKQATYFQITQEYATLRLSILEKELKEVSIRVNLFEKVLIPRCIENIKKIKIFLGDLQLAQVGQAKVAKRKILERKQAHIAQEHTEECLQ